MDSITITKAQWDALKSLHEGDKCEIIYALFENAFEGKQPKFDEWRREEKMAIYNLLKS